MKSLTYGGWLVLLVLGTFLAGCNAESQLYSPVWVTVDKTGNAYIVDANHTISKISAGGEFSVLAGKAGEMGSRDGQGALARFNEPRSVAVDTQGNIYVVDGKSSSTIRKISPTGLVTTLAGTAGVLGSNDGVGAEASFTHPSDITLDGEGNAYVTDTRNFTLRKISPNGLVTTIAGMAGEHGDVDDEGSDARFTWPRGIVSDGRGALFVTDAGAIRRINWKAEVRSIAGDSWRQGSINGNKFRARFDEPTGIAVDAEGALYIADSNNSMVRKVSRLGLVSTFAGSPGIKGSRDGKGTAANFKKPKSVAVDTSGNVYVADPGDHAIRKITPNGEVTTLARGTAPVIDEPVELPLVDEGSLG